MSLFDGFPAVPDQDAPSPGGGAAGRSGPTLTLSPLSPSSGWKLNPVVGAVYAPELYAGKLSFSSCPRSLHHLPRSDPRASAAPPPPELSPPPFPNQSRPERGGADKAADPGPAEPLFARRAGAKLLEEERKERRRLRAAPLQPLSDARGGRRRWICQVRQIDFYRANRIREMERAIALAATPANGASPFWWR